MDHADSQVIETQISHSRQQIEQADDDYAADPHVNQMTQGLSQTPEAARPAS